MAVFRSCVWLSPLLVVTLLLPGPGVADNANCSLDGLWYDPGGSRDAQLIFEFATVQDFGPTVTAVTTNDQWTTGRVSYDPTTGNLSTYLDNGATQVGTVNLTSCTDIKWSQPSDPMWLRVPKVDKVHVVFMNHLDVGYNGIPTTGFINNVLNTYFNVYFPRAIELAAEMKATHPNEGFIYTTHPWLVGLYLDCPPNMVLNGIRLECPSASEVQAFEAAIHKGYIAWHAGAMNIQVELMIKEVFEASLQVSSDLDARFGRKTSVLSQRDVPGMTVAAIPVLLNSGIRGLTVGVNSGSAPPAVPNLFHWEYQGARILAMWHPGGYPGNPGKDIRSAGGLSLFDCVIEPVSRQALAFAFRTDNSGPPESIDELEVYYEILRGEFFNAKVFASTYDDFLQSIDTKTLPVVQGEIGDTWIQGVASDPRKLAEFQAASAGFAACMQENKCNLSDPQVSNASRFLIKLPEHTWGLPDVHDTVNWTNAAFQEAKRGKNYINCENSWIEQRYFLNLTLQASYGHPLHEYITKALAELHPQPPSLEGYTSVDPTQTFKLLDDMITLGFDSKSGWISTLIYHYSMTSLTFASSGNPMAELQYYTYNESDFQYMNSRYDYYGNAGYDKPNSTLNADPQSSVYSTLLDKLYQSKADPTKFILQLSFSQVAHSYYGAPSEVWLTLALLVQVYQQGVELRQRTKVGLGLRGLG